MDYQVILAPDLELTPDTFISAWNDDPECRNKAQAESLHEPPAAFPVDPATALVFLGGVAATIATGVITNRITELLKKKLLKAMPQAPPEVEIVVIEQVSRKESVLSPLKRPIAYWRKASRCSFAVWPRGVSSGFANWRRYCLRGAVSFSGLSTASLTQRKPSQNRGTIAIRSS
jgi:hypothetical protein